MNNDREQFLEVLNNNYQYILMDSIFSCLDYYNTDFINLGNLPQIDSYAERQFDKTLPVGNRLLRTPFGNNEDYNRTMLDYIFNEYSLDNYPENRTLNINSNLLQKREIIEFLNNCYNENYIDSIRITDDNYTLDEETYNRISFLNNIAVYNSEVERENVRIIERHYDYIYGYNSNGEVEADFIIKENISDRELTNIIEGINSMNGENPRKISIRFYNPTRAVELINRIDSLGLDSSVAIEILGYPLTENSEVYNSLTEISKRREISVTYVCCHDLLNNYCHEPFAIENTYISELEPGAKTSLDLYVKMLKFAEKFEQDTSDINSNIEKTMAAYQFLNDNYYYDLNAGETKNYGATRDLDKIMDTDEIVCAGYANLLTLMCRRVGIPMFTYGAPQHAMNVARIIDKDENGNVIFDKICTFDSTNDCGYYRIDEQGNRVRVENKDSYTFFGLDPEIWLHNDNPSFLTLANSLALTPQEFNNYRYISRSPRSSSYIGTYDAESFRYSMLHLMGYNFENYGEMNDVVQELQDQERIGGIPNDMIIRAARNLERRKHPEMSEQEFESHMEDVLDRINNSFDYRQDVFTNIEPQIELFDNEDYVVTVNTYRNQREIHNHIDLDAIDIGPVPYQDLHDLPNGNNPIDEDIITHELPPIISPGTNAQNQFTEEDFQEGYIAGTTIRKPRFRGTYETDEEYIEFLRRYYEYYLPSAREESNSLYHLTRDQIIQDLPINSREEQHFNAEGMSEEEINNSRSILR